MSALIDTGVIIPVVSMLLVFFVCTIVPVLRAEKFRILFLIEYFIACLMALIFAIYCSGRVGFFILFYILLTLIVSLVSPFIMAKSIRIRVVPSGTVFGKGESFTVTYEVKKPFALMLLSEIDIREKVSGGIRECGGLRLKKGGIKKEALYEREYRAVYAGGAVIEPQTLVVRDFLAICEYCFDVSLEVEGRDGRIYLGVLPAVRQMGDTRDLDNALRGADLSGDGEDTIEETTGGFGGFPGYDHREYVPGDPVKRINYKLSARRNELYVRLDEKQVYGSVDIFIDPKAPENVEEKDLDAWWEYSLEETLSLCENLLSRQFTVKLSYVEEGTVISHILRREGDAVSLSPVLAFCRREDTSEKGGAL